MSANAHAGAGKRWALALGAMALVVGTAAILFFFDPEKYGFYPICPLHQLTGWECPGCGTLRAMHQLSHGNLAAAWRLNPLTVTLLPVAGWLGAREFVWQMFGIRWPAVVARPAVGWALAAIVIIFGVARNLPGWHF